MLNCHGKEPGLISAVTKVLDRPQKYSSPFNSTHRADGPGAVAYAKMRH